MKFILIDSILSRESGRIVALKQVSLAEEYLADHFPGFPVLPGVLMIEAMAQAARTMLENRAPRLVLGEVKALKYGNMVRPGRCLEVEVTLDKENPDGSFVCRGTGRLRGLMEPSKDGSAIGGASGGETAVSGRFTMRPIRTVLD